MMSIFAHKVKCCHVLMQMGPIQFVRVTLVLTLERAFVPAQHPTRVGASTSAELIIARISLCHVARSR
jgi:hypothetical protein